MKHLAILSIDLFSYRHSCESSSPFLSIMLPFNEIPAFASMTTGGDGMTTEGGAGMTTEGELA
jgi:hypothetical protein